MSHQRLFVPRPAAPVRPASQARRAVLVSATACLLAACNSQIYVDAAQAFTFLIVGRPDVPLTRDQVRKIPYATLRAKIGKGQRALLVLNRYDGSDLHWVSADRVALTTRRGRLVKTAGMPVDLRYTQFIGGDPVAGGLVGMKRPTTWTRLIDLDPGAHYGVPVEATLEPLGEERIEILELTYDTVKVRERNYAALLDWEFENQFWAETSSGVVWRSLQHIAPELPPIEIELLKRATNSP
jgi:hypothetical protein